MFETACFESECCNDRDVHRILRLLTTTMRIRPRPRQHPLLVVLPMAGEFLPLGQRRRDGGLPEGGASCHQRRTTLLATAAIDGEMHTG